MTLEALLVVVAYLTRLCIFASSYPLTLKLKDGKYSHVNRPTNKSASGTRNASWKIKLIAQRILGELGYFFGGMENRK